MLQQIFIGVIGPTELILIAGGILLLFGGKKIPELMKGIGQGIKEFKKAKDEPPVKDLQKPNEDAK
jgi:sec-independent protein translocase protein TatA